MPTKNKQKVVSIPVKDLVLWTENPRDIIPRRNTNKAIIKQALDDDAGRWEIEKLARTMGPRYDFSELPTVVRKNEQYVVYDGNRRVILAMLSLGVYPEFNGQKFRMPECPSKMPCCLASEDIAIQSIWRKHGATGTWDQVSRDLFLYKFMGRPKSVLLQLDEMLRGKVSAAVYLNKRFVGEEVLTNARLKNIGIRIDDGKVFSRHAVKHTRDMLAHIFSLLEEKKISTRRSRRVALSTIMPAKLKVVIGADSEKPYQQVRLGPQDFKGLAAPLRAVRSNVRLPRRVESPQMQFFGEKLSLDSGEPANLYRDILDLYYYYEENKTKLSDRFPALIRMALRLECELVGRCCTSQEMGAMVLNDFDQIKASLTHEQKSFLSQNAVKKNNIVELLQTGAHNYAASYNLPQTIAMSLIVGGLLKLHCARGRRNNG